MKSVIKGNVEEKQEELVFPVLIESTPVTGLVVLFTSADAGMVVADKSTYRYNIGHYFDYWIEATNKEEWKKFTGTVELSN
jgi:hypothetical protein